MKPKVIIISKRNEPSLQQLMQILKELNYECPTIVYTINKLKNLKTDNFKGFFIFCLPPSEIKEWKQLLEDKIPNFFKIYCYNFLVEHKIDSSIFLNFDYIIAGEEENGILNKQLVFLKLNYWRKIPVTKLGMKNGHRSMLLMKLFRMLERTDINSITLAQVSKQLNISKDRIRREIKCNLNMHYSDLKFFLIQYYREYYPENFS
jgi:hypothetical protein